MLLSGITYSKNHSEGLQELDIWRETVGDRLFKLAVDEWGLVLQKAVGDRLFKLAVDEWGLVLQKAVGDQVTVVSTEATTVADSLTVVTD